MIKRDERYSIQKMYASFKTLLSQDFIQETICITSFTHNNKKTSLPILSFRTNKKGKAIWILSGIHGEEPAGPNALSDSTQELAKLAEEYPIVLIPLCNPSGYLRNWRYLNKKKYHSNIEGKSVSDSEHLLLNTKGNNTRKQKAASSISLALTNHILSLIKEYPPRITIDLHEDNLLSQGYIYSQGQQGIKDKTAQAIVNILKKSKIPLQMQGKTRFNEPIIKGIIGPVKDGSIDELFSAKKISVKGKIIPGPNVKTVIVFETPALHLKLQERKIAHRKLIQSLKTIIQK